MENTAEVIDTADSGDFDMESGVDTLSSDLFGIEKEEPSEEVSDEDTVEEVAEDAEETESDEPEVPQRAAPQSWKKEMHEKFSTLPAEVQDYIEQREQQMKDGLDINKNDANLGRNVRDIMAPYQNELTQAGVDSAHMIKSLMGAHYRLATSNPQEKAQIMQELAKNYGVSFQQNEQGQTVAGNIDPEITALRNEINSLKSRLSTGEESARQAEQSKITHQVNEFAETHEYFDEVSDQVVAFINNGDTLEDAYEKAVWANPIVRQKELDRIENERVDAENKAKMEKVRKAKQAKAVNVDSRETSQSPTGFLGSMEDTMRDTYRDIQNRT